MQKSIELYWQNMSRAGDQEEDGRQRDNPSVNAQTTTTEMALGGTVIQDFLLDGELDGGELDFLNPMVGLEDFSFLGQGSMATGPDDSG